MARSQHSTRRALHEAARWDFGRREAKQQCLAKARREIAAKRRIKVQVRAERRRAGWTPPAPVAVEAIPIRILEEGRFIHYPASAEDLREVLRRLPAGVADGIEAIELTLGKDCQREYVARKELQHPEMDPFTGRHGLAFPRSIHSGWILGTYSSPRGLVRLHAYVYDPAMPNLRIKETWLKLLFLSTFVHEVAHHEDRSRRLGRGRWRFDDPGKKESFAERTEHDWVKEVVVPYLAEAHPERVAELEDWIAEQGGIRIPWAWLGVDPQLKVKGGRLVGFSVLDISGAFAELVQDVESGLERRTRRRNLAMNLHFGDHFELALEIVEGLLAEDPGDLDSLTAKADYLNHLERNAEAAAILRRVLAKNPELEDAWHIQGLVFQDTKDWAGVLEATTQELRLAADRHPFVVARQARAPSSWEGSENSTSESRS